MVADCTTAGGWQYPFRAFAAKAATTTVPIVFVTGGDPVRDGLVTNLNRPGGNVTGGSGGSYGKAAWLRVQRRPRALLLLVDPNSPLLILRSGMSQRSELASAIGQQIEVLYVGGDREIETAFTTTRPTWGWRVARGGTGGTLRREMIVALAADIEFPRSMSTATLCEAGGLDAPSITDAYREAGIYAGRILKGEKPADLPVMQSTKFELVLDLKTAKAVGLEIPDKLLALADW